MRTLTAILLALNLSAHAAWANDVAAGDVEPNVQSNNVTYLTDAQEGGAPLDRQDSATGVSALDISLFGVISLGIIGLFWIRRHTSEL